MDQLNRETQFTVRPPTISSFKSIKKYQVNLKNGLAYSSVLKVVILVLQKLLIIEVRAAPFSIRAQLGLDLSILNLQYFRNKLFLS